MVQLWGPACPPQPYLLEMDWGQLNNREIQEPSAPVQLPHRLIQIEGFHHDLHPSCPLPIDFLGDTEQVSAAFWAFPSVK